MRHFLSSGNYKHYVVYISTREDVLVHCDIPCDSYSDLQVKLLQEARKSKMAMVCCAVIQLVFVLFID